MVLIEGAERSQFSAVVELLAKAHLPTGDLDPDSMRLFLVARDEDQLVGAIALEPYGDVGLLRSLVVTEGRRGTGVGSSLVDAIERTAVERGVMHVALLTETAQAFFSARGYATTGREGASAAVKSSSEFSLLCPVTAVYMERTLR